MSKPWKIELNLHDDSFPYFSIIEFNSVQGYRIKIVALLSICIFSSPFCSRNIFNEVQFLKKVCKHLQLIVLVSVNAKILYTATVIVVLCLLVVTFFPYHCVRSTSYFSSIQCLSLAKSSIGNFHLDHNVFYVEVSDFVFKTLVFFVRIFGICLQFWKTFIRFHIFFAHKWATNRKNFPAAYRCFQINRKLWIVCSYGYLFACAMPIGQI